VTCSNDRECFSQIPCFPAYFTHLLSLAAIFFRLWRNDLLLMLSFLCKNRIVKYLFYLILQ
jgi:hypothetical protein